MSNSPNVGNFAEALVEMAKATEELPKARAEIDRQSTMIEDYAKQVQSLELRAIDRKNEIDKLVSRINDLEVARDDAELRFLEADETLHNVLGNLRSVQASLGSAVATLDPPKAESEPKAEPMGQSDADPTMSVNSGEPKSDQTSVASSAIEDATFNDSPTASPTWTNYTENSFPEVKTEAAGEPTATNLNINTAKSEIADGHPAENIKSALASDTPPSGPYSGKRYYDHPVYVSLDDWIAGGGAAIDYHWCPERLSTY